MIDRLVKRFREEGIRGLETALRSRIARKRNVHPIQDALKVLSKGNRVCLIQIGAFIGDTENDPLHRFLTDCADTGIALKAVLVEPVREFYEKLKWNYRGVPGIHFENVAIAETSGPQKFYRLGVDPVAHGFPAWLSQLGSLKDERMTTMWDNCERSEDCKAFYLQHRVVDTIDCITSRELFERNGISEIDLLQIDAEGYDFEILRTIDFQTIRPRFINYERMLLQEAEPECRGLMRRAGYRLIDFQQDTFCIKQRKIG